jgi:hypothetical protein
LVSRPSPPLWRRWAARRWKWLRSPLCFDGKMMALMWIYSMKICGTSGWRTPGMWETWWNRLNTSANMTFIVWEYGWIWYSSKDHVWKKGRMTP